MQFERLDLQTWKAPEAAYDVVVSQEVIEHLEDQPQHITTAYTLLDPEAT